MAAGADLVVTELLLVTRPVHWAVSFLKLVEMICAERKVVSRRYNVLWLGVRRVQLNAVSAVIWRCAVHVRTGIEK